MKIEGALKTPNGHALENRNLIIASDESASLMQSGRPC